jgi:hypothetical protein
MVMRLKGLWVLTIAGASAFWMVNLLISLILTPIAAEYRSALSIRYPYMLLEAAVGSILIGIVVSWALLRLPDRIPGNTPIVKSLVMSLIVLITVTALIEAPAKFTGSLGLGEPWRYFFIALMFNALSLRIPALGIVIGYPGNRAPGP